MGYVGFIFVKVIIIGFVFVRVIAFYGVLEVESLSVKGCTASILRHPRV